MGTPSSRFIRRSLDLWKREPREPGKKLHRGRLLLIALGVALAVGIAILS
jgi:hypothetical protein